MLFLGIDLGSSSIKLSVLDGLSGDIKASVSYPKDELPIHAPQPGWAEQDPELWWTNLKIALRRLSEKGLNLGDIGAIGISYQMHGLVVVDQKKQVLRPSIIWCDSRAFEYGAEAFKHLGGNQILPRLLNSPGNFTASKLAWVKENEPDIYKKVFKFMLPGDYLAMKLSGEITTTASGLSEGILWDFHSNTLSTDVVNVFGLDSELIPKIEPSIGSRLQISNEAAKELGLKKGVQITYRAGDQPNNAFSLNVLNPGETAATAGTSGVIYAVTDKNAYDSKSRINTFRHVNSDKNSPRNGVLICINGTGILYSWLKKLLNTGNGSIDYKQMNDMVDSVKAGSDGLMCLPFGNGAERIFENRILGSHFLNLDFNRHSNAHLLRAATEGIVFALNLGFEMLGELGIPQKTIRAGKANLFLSESFREIFVNVTGTRLELYDTDGAAGAARGAALGLGYFESAEAAFDTLQLLDSLEPEESKQKEYKELFSDWKATITKHSF